MTKRREGTDSALLTALSYTVRERREVLRLSQEEVAHRAKLHRTYISDIERGARNLSLNSLYDLARALELSTSDLIITAEERLPSVRAMNSATESSTAPLTTPTTGTTMSTMAPMFVETLN